MTSAWDDPPWGQRPAAPRACTTCGISAPRHGEAIALGIVAPHAWAEPSTTSTPTQPTRETEEQQ